MNLTWLRDYGALAAATIAAVAAVVTAVMQSHRLRQVELDKWRRDSRLPRYADLLEAALKYRQALFGELGTWDPQLLGPEPKSWPNLEESQAHFNIALASVRLLGPADVTSAANEVQFSLWHYRDQLEMDSFRYDQTPSSLSIAQFTTACQSALGVEEVPDQGSDAYRAWRARLDLAA